MYNELEKVGQFFVNSIKANLQKYNRNATGKASASLRFEIKENGNVTTLQVLGEQYIYHLEYGRGATKQRGGGVFTVKNIADWIIAKGIQSELPLNTLAFLIYRKINRDGYKGTVGVITDAINPNTISQIAKKVGAEVTQTIVKDIKNAISRTK